jgi:hypothetical protein
MFRHPCQWESATLVARLRGGIEPNANLLQGYYEAPTSYNDATGSSSKKTRSSDPSKRKKKKKKSFVGIPDAVFEVIVSGWIA